MTTRRGRPPIKPFVKKLIYDRAQKQKGMPRLALAVELGKLIKDMGEVPPTEETMLKHISRARHASSFDELWSLADLVEHPLPPEAMPAVMRFYKEGLQDEYTKLTSREAQWIARLYKVIDPPELVGDWARLYAWEEWISEITDTSFNTTELDDKLLTDPGYAEGEYIELSRELHIWDIAQKYRADPEKLKDLSLSLVETEEAAKSGKYPDTKGLWDSIGGTK